MALPWALWFATGGFVFLPWILLGSWVTWDILLLALHHRRLRSRSAYLLAGLVSPVLGALVTGLGILSLYALLFVVGFWFVTFPYGFVTGYLMWRVDLPGPVRAGAVDQSVRAVMKEELGELAFHLEGLAMALLPAPPRGMGWRVLGFAVVAMGMAWVGLAIVDAELGEDVFAGGNGLMQGQVIAFGMVASVLTWAILLLTVCRWIRGLPGYLLAGLASPFVGVLWWMPLSPQAFSAVSNHPVVLLIGATTGLLMWFSTRRLPDLFVRRSHAGPGAAAGA